MKKVIAYILLFFGMFLSNSCPAAPLESTQNSNDTIAFHTTSDNNTVVFDAFQNDSGLYKNDFLNDNDDHDDFDDDDHVTSINDKLFSDHVSYCQSASSNFRCIDTVVCNTIVYYNANTSRLPRFNYISLRVLRL